MLPTFSLPAPAGATAALAEAAAGLSAHQIPEDVQLVARTCLLDWLTVALAGSTEPATRMVRALSAPGDFPLIGGGTAALGDAVLVNGTAGHVLDFDDVHLGMLGHATAPVLPALISATQLNCMPGSALLTALVAGIEVECQLGSWLAWANQSQGFHTTATLGIFGAAAATSNLLGLGRDQAAIALSLAATGASGLKGAFGTTGKSLQVGRAAREGMYAALLARQGASAPPDLIEATSGFAEAYASRRPGDGAAFYPQDEWQTLKVIFKYFPCCYMTHSSIAAGVELHNSDLDVDLIEEIELLVAPRTAELCDNPQPATALEGKFSLSYTLATALLSGAVTEAAFAAGALSDRRVRELNDRVRVVVVDDHREFASLVNLRLTDGSARTAVVDVSQPVALDKLDRQWQKVAEKAVALLGRRLGAGPADQVVDMVHRLDELNDLTPLWKLCRLS